jgi:hypothetical protein
MNFNSQ